MATLDQRLCALENQRRVQSGGEMMLVFIQQFGLDGSPIERDAQRVVSGTGQEWLRQDGETEAQFLERAKRAGGALGLKVLTVASPIDGSPEHQDC